MRLLLKNRLLPDTFTDGYLDTLEVLVLKNSIVKTRNTPKLLAVSWPNI
jgi:hypothetical protein